MTKKKTSAKTATKQAAKAGMTHKSVQAKKPAAKAATIKAPTAKAPMVKAAKAKAKSTAKPAPKPAQKAKAKPASKPQAKAAPPKIKATAKAAAPKVAPKKPVAKNGAKPNAAKPSGAKQSGVQTNAPKMSASALLRMAADQLKADGTATKAKPAAQPAKPAVVTPKPANTNRPPLISGLGAKPKAVIFAKPDFGMNDYVVYPTHGVGKIIAMEKRELYGEKIEMFVVEFSKEKMTLRVPIMKVGSIGMRRLSSPGVMKTALDTLKGRARIKRAMWSRRAQEYEAKINSGDPVSIAEVIRDLHRNAGQPDQSYSERQIYEAAMERLTREYAAVEKIDEDAAVKRLEKLLQAA